VRKRERERERALKIFLLERAHMHANEFTPKIEGIPKHISKTQRERERERERE